MHDEFALESLVVKNFRSISGEVVVPIRAPVVLIHGPNGAGKSSLMTALALALGGSAISGLAAPKHLVHHGAECAEITLGTSDGVKRTRIASDDDHVEPGALDAKDAAFLAERCYLEQTKLTRLLELYQDTPKGNPESALTRFVKELLRIDELDALVDGLHLAGDVRRVDREIPLFREWRGAHSDLGERDASIAQELLATEAEIAELETAVRSGLAGLHASDTGLDPVRVERALEQRDDQVSLAGLETLALRLAGLARRRVEVEVTSKTSSMDDADGRLAAAQARQAQWWGAHGHTLSSVLDELRADFPRLPPLQALSPSEVYDQAAESLNAELERITNVLAADDRTLAELKRAEMEVVAARERLGVLDRELADETAFIALGDLARVLADMVPHVVGDACPVCGRDYSEISPEPLSAHLAAEISRLGARASQLQSTARARLETTTDLQHAEEMAGRLLAQRLPPERRSSEQKRHQQLTAVAERLHKHEQGARLGGAIMRDVGAAEASVSQTLGRDRAQAQWREELEQLAAEVGTSLATDTSAARVTELGTTLEGQLAELRRRQTLRVEVKRQWEELLGKRAQAARLAAERERISMWRGHQAGAVQSVQHRMRKARDLRNQVEEVRRSIITSVFNSALNDVWAALFVRLAPDEPYVPAFSDPAPTGPLTTTLETRRRDGTRGGSPNDMLSAGNLNTAALTLFLALHLSVSRRVPWLLLDDPVQSMDEIHVSQFAALLRTLTQQHRRRIFIAVHERALFEYLALELSPATPESGLVTVELRRERNGRSSVATDSRPYKPDTAVKAA